MDFERGGVLTQINLNFLYQLERLKVSETKKDRHQKVGHRKGNDRSNLKRVVGRIKVGYLIAWGQHPRRFRQVSLTRHLGRHLGL